MRGDDMLPWFGTNFTELRTFKVVLVYVLARENKYSNFPTLFQISKRSLPKPLQSLEKFGKVWNRLFQAISRVFHSQTSNVTVV